MKISTTCRKFIIIAIWLLIWQVVAGLVNHPLILASPVMALRALVELCTQSDFWVSILNSGLRIVLGFFVGTALGIILGALSCRHKLIKDFLAPAITVLKSVPLASFIVLLIIWWGSRWLSTSVSVIVVFPQIYLGVTEGMQKLDAGLLDVAKVFRLPKSSVFNYMYRPAVKPSLLAALKMALGMCFKSGVAAEVIGTPAFSIGNGLYMSKIYLNTAELMAWSLMVILLACSFEKVVLSIYEWYMNTKPKCLPPMVPVMGARNVSMVFQENHLLEDESAVKNVELVLGDADLARRALKKLLPDDCLDEPVKNLSGGMKRRVAVVRAVEADSDILLLDEPFTGLDDENREKVLEYIKANAKGRKVIMASHDY